MAEMSPEQFLDKLQQLVHTCKVEEGGQSILHEFMLKQNGELIGELFKKYNDLSSLPEKVDNMTTILQQIQQNLQTVSKHDTQIAVILKTLEDYSLARKQQQEDHDKVIKMDTEWNLVKYGAPIIAALVGGILGRVWTKLWP